MLNVNVLCKTRTRSVGVGLAFLVHNSVLYTPISNELDSSDPYMECKSWNSEKELCNVYYC